MIVVDNGSTDKTVEKAAEMGARIIKSNSSDFSVLRNLGREKASFPWLLYLDADERVTEKLRREILQAVKKDERVNGYIIKRQNYYFGTKWPFTEKMLRLIKKDALISWQGKLHETAKIRGKILHLNSPLLHFTHNDLQLMVKKTNKWSQIEADLRFAANHPKITWWRIIRVMLTFFYRSYFKQGGWKVGTTGFIESTYQAFSSFITYAKLWEKQKLQQKS